MDGNKIASAMERTYMDAMHEFENTFDDDYVNDCVLDAIAEFKNLWVAKVVALAAAAPAPVAPSPPPKKVRKSKTKVDVASAPKAKRAPSEYNLFVQRKKDELIAAGFKGKDLMKEAARMWNEHKAAAAKSATTADA